MHFSQSPPEIQNIILCLLPVEAQYVARAVCKSWRDPMSSGRCSPNELILWGARNNYPNVCRLAMNWGATQIPELLFAGIIHEHIEICKLAVGWGMDTSTVMHTSVIQGKKSICQHLKKWGLLTMKGCSY